MSSTKRASAYVGRVGALALALGVGAAVATGGTGMAWADSTDSSTTSSSQDSTTRASSTKATPSGPAKAGSAPKSTSTASTSEPTSSDRTGPTTRERRTPGGAVFGSGRDRTEPRIVPRISDSLKQATAAWRNGGSRTDTAPDVDKPGKVDENATPDPSTEQPVDESAKPPAPSEKNSTNDVSAAAPERTPQPVPERTRASQSRTGERTAVASLPDLATPVRATTIAPTTALIDRLPDRLTERRVTALESLRETVTASVARAATALPTVTVAPTAQLTAASTDASTEQPEQPRAPKLVTGLLAAVGLAPFAANSPLAPAQSTPLLALLGWARRESDRALTQQARTLPTARPAITTAAVVDPLPGDLIDETRDVGWVTGPQSGADGFGIAGTDLGIMWDAGYINGVRAIHVAFGDTFSLPGMAGDWRSNALVYSYDQSLGNGLGLEPTGYVHQFIPGGQGLSWLFPTEVTVIPTAGIHANDTQYVNHMSVRQWGVPGSWTTNFSAISQFVAGPNGGQWVLQQSSIRSSGWFRSSTPYRPGDQNFQQMAYVKAPEAADGEPQYIYAFGTPSGRQGSVHLSRVAEEDITDVSKYEYWDGNAWVSSAAHAAPIIGDSTRSAGLFGFVVDWANDPNVFGGYLGGLFGAKTGGNVSEMSVQYNEYLDKYVILYGDGNNNIQMRIADTPEGEWSAPITLATSQDYPGLYAPMIHPWSGTGELDDDDHFLYWNMSLWGPYNVMLMETDLSPLKVQQV